MSKLIWKGYLYLQFSYLLHWTIREIVIDLFRISHCQIYCLLCTWSIHSILAHASPLFSYIQPLLIDMLESSIYSSYWSLPTNSWASGTSQEWSCADRQQETTQQWKIKIRQFHLIHLFPAHNQWDYSPIYSTTFCFSSYHSSQPRFLSRCLSGFSPYNSVCKWNPKD